MSEKLQKVLARVGLGSRRHMEDIISAGRISVNGQIAQLGDRVNVGDEIRLDGRKIQFQLERESRRRVLIYYKPEGEICSRQDPEGRPTVFDHLPTISRDRWVMVGRLDINSSGLLLFTNDGELANRLMHPSHQIQREYAVRVMGEVTEKIRQTLLKGVELEDGFAKFESFVDLGGEGINRWYQVVVKEGRNREVRRLFESQGLKVSRLLRTRYGVIHLPRELRTGRWLELDQLAIDQLAKSVNLAVRQTMTFNEDTKRRVDKLLDHPMKARRVDHRQKSTPSHPHTSTETRPLTRYSPTGKYLGSPEKPPHQHSSSDKPNKPYRHTRQEDKERLSLSSERRTDQQTYKQRSSSRQEQEKPSRRHSNEYNRYDASSNTRGKPQRHTLSEEKQRRHSRFDANDRQDDRRRSSSKQKRSYSEYDYD